MVRYCYIDMLSLNSTTVSRAFENVRQHDVGGMFSLVPGPFCERNAMRVQH
jgi:hypothetical protein